MRGQPTLQHGCYFVLYHSFPISTILFFMRLSDYPSLFTANFVIALNSVNANRLVRYTFNNRHIMKSFRKLSLMRFPIIRRSPGLQGFYQSLSLYCNYLLDSFKCLKYGIFKQFVSYLSVFHMISEYHIPSGQILLTLCNGFLHMWQCI